MDTNWKQKYKKTATYKEKAVFYYAEDRFRTGTKVTLRRILSPVRLPVPPPRQNMENPPLREN